MLNNPIDTDIRNVEGLSTGGSKGKVFSLVGVVFLIGAVSLYAFYTRPLWADYKNVSEAAAAKELKISDLGAEIESFKTAEKNMDIGTEVEKVTLLNSVPVGVNQDGVIEDLVKIAKANEIELKSVSFGLSDNVYEGVGALSVSASFEGNYSDLINFLEGIEENARLFKVSAVNVQINRVEGVDVKRVTFSLVMDAFYQK